MADTWKHPMIGEFQRGDFGWSTAHPNPWPGVFSGMPYDPDDEPPRDPFTGEPCDEQEMSVLKGESIPIVIEFHEGDTEPRPLEEAVKLLDQFWSIRDSFPKLACAYIWSDFKGEQGNRMWWSGMDDELWSEAFEYADAPSPESAEDLFVHLAPPAITVRYYPEASGESLTINPFTGEPLDKPARARPAHPAYWAVEFGFGCSWEEEHNFALYWRNGEFIGTAYGDGQGSPREDYQP